MTLASRAPTRIQLCGTTIVEAGGERLEGRLPGRQGRILFAFLVLNRDRPTSRSELAEAVWPGESSQAASETGLTPLISKLRRMLGADRLDGHATIRLVLDADARVDVEDAVSSVHRAESQLALGNFTARLGTVDGGAVSWPNASSWPARATRGWTSSDA